MTTHIRPSILDFLKQLKDNNNRPWFNAHKDQYLVEKTHFQRFADSLLDRMSMHDNIEQMRTYRIYRDVRFSKNKLPYKSNMAGGMKRATKWLRGGYYFHIEPGASMVGGGFWGPNSADLKRIRQEIAADDQPLREIIADPVFQSTFGQLEGEGVKTAPRGYKKDHPAIGLLRHKQFLLRRNFTDEEVTSSDFLDKLVDSFVAMRPFFDYMSEVLTTDENGVPLED